MWLGGGEEWGQARPGWVCVIIHGGEGLGDSENSRESWFV